MSRKFATVLGASLIAANAVALFLIVTLPDTGEPFHYIPKVEALEPYKFWGCGLYTMDHSSTTHFYPDLKADDMLRRKIKDEMLHKGYRMRTSEYGVSYSKRYGFLSLYSGYVHVGNQGRVTVGAGHSKWPF